MTPGIVPVPMFLNQHSFLLAAAAAVLLLAVLLFRDGVRPADLLALGALLAGLGIAYGLARPRPGLADDVASVRARIGAGRAVLVEFQSPY